MPQRTSTTRLPVALRDQIGTEAGQSTQTRQKQGANRKEARKQRRQQQKQRKASFFSGDKSTDLLPIHKRPREEHQEEPVQKRPRCAPDYTTSQQYNNDKQCHTSSATAPGRQNTLKSKLAVPRTTFGPKHHELTAVAKTRQVREDTENARIAWLETKLGINKGKNRAKTTTPFGDGLDDLMNDLDRIIPMDGTRSSVSASETEQENSEYPEFEGFSDAQGNEATDTDVKTNSQKTSGELTRGVTKVELDTTTSAQPGSRYIPPHLRQNADDGSETLLKLSRQMKGLLNRVSEQNMASILGSIGDLYRNHRRHDITSTLTKLMIDGISSHSSHLDSFVVLYASLIASLHKIVGIDFAAYFIQSLIASYEQHYQILRGMGFDDATGDDPKGKECLNLAVLLSELYNFQVVSCVLLYDVIRGLLGALDEFDVELLLKIVRSSGHQLRQDDPSALKDIIQMVRSKMSEKEQVTVSSRTQFMIETLANLNNNKAKRIAGYDGRSGSAERMKKFISGLSKKHHVMAYEPLRVSLDDLHSSEKKGKWWLVGSAWGGDPLRDRGPIDGPQPAAKDSFAYATNSLIELARKQGMNTDVRRSIFVVLMSSDDYVDACERLTQLHLTDVQQREIVRVILHCLGNEKQYNPFYTLVVQQLCRTSHSHKVTLQFCLWDFLRDLGEKDVGGAEVIKDLQDDNPHIPPDSRKLSPMRRLNIARAYAWWIVKGSSSITILKPVDFTILQPQSREFFRNLFMQLFISSQVTSPAIIPNADAAEHLTSPHTREAIEEVFIKATRISTLTKGLIYFLTTALQEDDGSNHKVVSGTLEWARDVAKDTLRTGMDIVPT